MFNSQNATPDVQAPGRRGRGAPASRSTTITETLAPPDATFQDWQTRAARGACARALATATGRVTPVTRPPRRPVVGCATRRCAVGGRTLWSGVDLTVRPRRVRRGPRPQRRRQVDADQGVLGLRAAGRRHRSSVLGRAAGRGQRPASATCRSAAASTRGCGSAASTSCGSASTATGGASRCPAPALVAGARAERDRVDEVDRPRRRHAPTPHRPIGAALRRRAAAAAHRPGAGVRGPGCCCSTSRSTASTCPTRRGRRAASADLPRARASPCCWSPTT